MRHVGEAVARDTYVPTPEASPEPFAFEIGERQTGKDQPAAFWDETAGEFYVRKRCSVRRHCRCRKRDRENQDRAQRREALKHCHVYPFFFLFWEKFSLNYITLSPPRQAVIANLHPTF